MLSIKLYSGITLFMSHVSIPMGVLPFSWCSHQKIFVKCSKARSRCVFNVFLLLLWISCLQFQILRFHLSKNHNSLNFTVAFTSALSVALEAFCLTLQFEDSFMSELNTILVYLRRVQGKKPPLVPFSPTVCMNLKNFHFFLQLFTSFPQIASHV